MSSNKHRLGRGLWRLLAAILLVAAFFQWRRHGPARDASPPTSITNAQDSLDSSNVVTTTNVNHFAASSSRFQQAFDVLNSASDAKATRRQLEEFRRALASMPTNEA